MLKIAFHKSYIHPLEENHRFPMIKYELIPEQLLIEKTCSESNFFKPEIIDTIIFKSLLNFFKITNKRDKQIKDDKKIIL